MITENNRIMNIKEKIKTAVRVFTLPKDWKAKGNMEFDELFFLATSHREIAEIEICARFNYWYREYCGLRMAITKMAALLFGLVIVCCAERHITILWLSGVLASVFITCMSLM